MAGVVIYIFMDVPLIFPSLLFSSYFHVPLIFMGLTQRELAVAIRVPYQRVNEIINGRRGITPSTALRLAKFFGVSPDFWMNLQLRWDLYFAKQSEADNLKTIKPLAVQH
jgi:addiction module HigA family antidote